MARRKLEERITATVNAMYADMIKVVNDNRTWMNEQFNQIHEELNEIRLRISGTQQTPDQSTRSQSDNQEQLLWEPEGKSLP